MKETALAEFIGVSRNQLRDIRKSQPDMEGKYWEKDGRDITWLPDGLYAACSVLGVDESLLRDILEPASAEAAESAKKEVRVAVTRFTRNHQIMMAEHEGQEIRVRVNSSRNFLIGMEIPVAHVQEDLWELIGRCPRARGRW